MLGRAGWGRAENGRRRGEAEDGLKKFFLRKVLKPREPELDENSPGHQGYQIRRGRWRKPGALLVPMLLNGGYGYAQLRSVDLFAFKRRL